VYAHVCLPVQMNDTYTVMTLLENYISHFFHTALFLSAIHTSL